MNSRFAVGSLPYAPNQKPMESYAGFIDIRNESHSLETNRVKASTFFWFFPAQCASSQEEKLILWLQGGPGSSSLIGLFEEMGPLRVNKDGLLERNPDSWNTKYAMLFVDNPVGTGYSFVGNKTSKIIKEPKSDILSETNASSLKGPYQCPRNGIDENAKWNNGYATNQAAVAHDLIVFFDRFYSEFPNYINVPLYIAGESYAGKYIPVLAYHIHKVNQHRLESVERRTLIPMKGIAIGNGLTDPFTQIESHAVQALSLGLIGEKVAKKMNMFVMAAKAFICRGEFKLALSAREALFDSFAQATGGINYYDIRKGNHSYDRSKLNTFLNDPSIKDAINVGQDTIFGKDWYIFPNLENDIMKSTVDYFPTLLENGYKVLLYQGQFDFRDGVLSQTKWINSLSWKYINRFREQDKKIWVVDGEITGYAQIYRNLAQVTVLNCGHLCPGDTNTTKDMITKFLID